MKRYWLIHLGRSNKFASDAAAKGYIGVNFLEDINLTADANMDFRAFQNKYVPLIMKKDKSRTKVSAGLASGNTWTAITGIKEGDVVIMPMGDRTYQAGEIIGGYYYEPCFNDSGVSQRRKVKWLGSFLRDEMSDSLKNSSGSIMTVTELSSYASEIEKLIGQKENIESAEVESVADFGLESHLEEFLIYNWDKSTLGKEYEIYSENGEILGQQYIIDVGRIDILALSKDKKTWLIIELKKGHGSDTVVGQIARYIGYAKENIAEKGQNVKGLIISGSDDKNIRYAISTMKDVDFMTYEVSFKLKPNK